MSYPEFQSDLSKAVFDYYKITFDEVWVEPIMTVLTPLFPEYDWIKKRGRNNYINAYELAVSDNLLAARLDFGGSAQNNTAQLEVKGYISQQVKDIMDKVFKDIPHIKPRPKRFDACLNWEEENLFDTIYPAMIEYAKQKDLFFEPYGNGWEGKGKRLNKGRSLYVGYRGTDWTLYVILYEKGKQMGLNPDWIRFEVRFRPPSENAEYWKSPTPQMLFHIQWVQELMEWLTIPMGGRLPIGHVKKPSSLHSKQASLVRQYGNTLREMALNAGSKEAFADVLLDAIQFDFNNPNAPVTKPKTAKMLRTEEFEDSLVSLAPDDDLLSTSINEVFSML